MASIDLSIRGTANIHFKTLIDTCAWLDLNTAKLLFAPFCASNLDQFGLSEGCYVLRSNVTDWSPEDLWLG
ncbi:MAG: hypothetical protein ABSG79_00745 [Bryobacteraceae bacterium]